MRADALVFGFAVFPARLTLPLPGAEHEDRLVCDDTFIQRGEDAADAVIQCEMFEARRVASGHGVALRY